ncbi:unnamed protein product [Angiostrongylus costaricensis]|uniref:PQ loop repeat protein n=1 Tax=Angiostrongylus costaricensis TaxID=334426 RepID=A0A0R3PGR2_ANGCS|nr:unnamed protein product [Angiostrongylus costaricensis]
MLLNWNLSGCMIFKNITNYYPLQRQYEEEHPYSPIPVLLNDVFFAVHALIACVFTAAQCFFYERGNQRVSFTCLAISATMIMAAFGGGVITSLGVINMLYFVTGLSYIKMIVTLLKYIPQAMQNFRRKSTTGWSIGNVLLDFTGGCLDILQMCLQCWNVSDWSAFYGNPVKFGLGLVSTLFDILFMTQHYVLYRNNEQLLAFEKSNQLTMGNSETDKFRDAEEDNGGRNSSSKSSHR